MPLGEPGPAGVAKVGGPMRTSATMPQLNYSRQDIQEQYLAANHGRPLNVLGRSGRENTQIPASSEVSSGASQFGSENVPDRDNMNGRGRKRSRTSDRSRSQSANLFSACFKSARHNIPSIGSMLSSSVQSAASSQRRSILSHLRGSSSPSKRAGVDGGISGSHTTGDLRQLAESENAGGEPGARRRSTDTTGELGATMRPKHVSFGGRLAGQSAQQQQQTHQSNHIQRPSARVPTMSSPQTTHQNNHLHQHHQQQQQQHQLGQQPTSLHLQQQKQVMMTQPYVIQSPAKHLGPVANFHPQQSIYLVSQEPGVRGSASIWAGSSQAGSSRQSLGQPSPTNSQHAAKMTLYKRLPAVQMRTQATQTDITAYHLTSSAACSTPGGLSTSSSMTDPIGRHATGSRSALAASSSQVADTPTTCSSGLVTEIAASLQISEPTSGSTGRRSATRGVTNDKVGVEGVEGAQETEQITRKQLQNNENDDDDDDDDDELDSELGNLNAATLISSSSSSSSLDECGRAKALSGPSTKEAATLPKAISSSRTRATPPLHSSSRRNSLEAHDLTLCLKPEVGSALVQLVAGPDDGSKWASSSATTGNGFETLASTSITQPPTASQFGPAGAPLTRDGGTSNEAKSSGTLEQSLVSESEGVACRGVDFFKTFSTDGRPVSGQPEGGLKNEEPNGGLAGPPSDLLHGGCASGGALERVGVASVADDDEPPSLSEASSQTDTSLMPNIVRLARREQFEREKRQQYELLARANGQTLGERGVARDGLSHNSTWEQTDELGDEAEDESLRTPTIEGSARSRPTSSSAEQRRDEFLQLANLEELVGVAGQPDDQQTAAALSKRSSTSTLSTRHHSYCSAEDLNPMAALMAASSVGTAGAAGAHEPMGVLGSGSFQTSEAVCEPADSIDTISEQFSAEDEDYPGQRPSDRERDRRPPQPEKQQQPQLQPSDPHHQGHLSDLNNPGQHRRSSNNNNNNNNNNWTHHQTKPQSVETDSGNRDGNVDESQMVARRTSVSGARAARSSSIANRPEGPADSDTAFMARQGAHKAPSGKQIDTEVEHSSLSEQPDRELIRLSSLRSSSTSSSSSSSLSRSSSSATKTDSGRSPAGKAGDSRKSLISGDDDDEEEENEQVEANEEPQRLNGADYVSTGTLVSSDELGEPLPHPPGEDNGSPPTTVSELDQDEDLSTPSFVESYRNRLESASGTRSRSNESGGCLLMRIDEDRNFLPQRQEHQYRQALEDDTERELVELSAETMALTEASKSNADHGLSESRGGSHNADGSAQTTPTVAQIQPTSRHQDPLDEDSTSLSSAAAAIHSGGSTVVSENVSPSSTRSQTHLIRGSSSNDPKATKRPAVPQKPAHLLSGKAGSCPAAGSLEESSHSPSAAAVAVTAASIAAAVCMHESAGSVSVSRVVGAAAGLRAHPSRSPPANAPSSRELVDPHQLALWKRESVPSSFDGADQPNEQPILLETDRFEPVPSSNQLDCEPPEVGELIELLSTVSETSEHENSATLASPESMTTQQEVPMAERERRKSAGAKQGQPPPIEFINQASSIFADNQATELDLSTLRSQASLDAATTSMASDLGATGNEMSSNQSIGQHQRLSRSGSLVHSPLPLPIDCPYVPVELDVAQPRLSHEDTMEAIEDDVEGEERELQQVQMFQQQHDEISESPVDIFSNFQRHPEVASGHPIGQSEASHLSGSRDGLDIENAQENIDDDEEEEESSISVSQHGVQVESWTGAASKTVSGVNQLISSERHPSDRSSPSSTAESDKTTTPPAEVTPTHEPRLSIIRGQSGLPAADFNPTTFTTAKRPSGASKSASTESNTQAMLDHLSRHEPLDEPAPQLELARPLLRFSSSSSSSATNQGDLTVRRESWRRESDQYRALPDLGEAPARTNPVESEPSTTRGRDNFRQDSLISTDATTTIKRRLKGTKTPRTESQPDSNGDQQPDVEASTREVTEEEVKSDPGLVTAPPEAAPRRGPPLGKLKSDHRKSGPEATETAGTIADNSICSSCSCQEPSTQLEEQQHNVQSQQQQQSSKKTPTSGLVEQTKTAQKGHWMSQEEGSVFTENYWLSHWLYISELEEAQIWRRPIEATGNASSSQLAGSHVDAKESPDRDDKNKTKIRGAQGMPSQMSEVEPTGSEVNFGSRYKSTTRKMIHRRAALEMYRRLASGKPLHREKRVEINRSNGEFGFRIHGSRPVVVSAIERGTSAESCGLEVGDLIYAINGTNILEMAHSEVVKLAHSTNSAALLLDLIPTNGFLASDQYRETTSSGLSSNRYEPLMAGLLMRLSPSTAQPLLVELQQQMNNSKGISSKERGKRLNEVMRLAWRRRYFVLRGDNCLYWYKSPKDLEPLGGINLQGFSASLTSEFSEPNHVIRLVKYAGQPHYLATNSLQDVQSWVDALNRAATEANQNDPYMKRTLQLARGRPGLIPEPDCNGYLYKLSHSKRGGGAHWRIAYFVLKDACLYLFKDTGVSPSSVTQASAVYYLHGYRVRARHLESKRYTFELVPPNRKTIKPMYLMADSESDKRRWIAALEYSIDRWIVID